MGAKGARKMSNSEAQITAIYNAIHGEGTEPGIKGDVAALKKDVKAMPGVIDAAINLHTLSCINRKVDKKVSISNGTISPKVIASLVGAIVALTGALVAIIEGLR